MLVGGLLIPDLLEAMLAEGRWPRTADEALKQNLESRIPADRNRRLRRIYLYPPPFHTLARIITNNGQDFYSRFGALNELVPEASIEIADFGLGSDATILLDYQFSLSAPRLIHLEWGNEGESNHWVVLAPDFNSFVNMLGV